MVVARKTMRYAITDLGSRPSPPGRDPREDRHSRLLANLDRWTTAGVDFLQLREKSLAAEEVFALANTASLWLRRNPESTATRLLVNSRADIAAAAGADGVHLTAQPRELRPEQVRAVFRAAGLAACTVSVSCHTPGEVSAARGGGADLILFGPVFEKRVGGEQAGKGTGLALLEHACEVAGSVPVLALGGVTEAAAVACLRAGAAGVAGIRLFG